MAENLKFALGDLANPLCYADPLALSGYCSKEHLSQLLAMMLTIRLVEQAIADLVKLKKVNCPCHLGIGQEAVAAGIATLMRKSDYVFGTHRAHSQYLALGGDIYALLAEVFGKADGCSGGMGGSMHLTDVKNGFIGSVPIVAGTISIAAGAALAAKLKGQDNIAVCFFGDGAVEEGGFHETMNLAASQKLPLLFVCENNLYASHLDINQRQPSDSAARFAAAHGMDYRVVDGNDVIAMENAAAVLITNIRKNKTPGFIEAVTYRWLGHVGPNDDIDVGVRRSMQDLANWKKRDPIKRLLQVMLTRKMITEKSYKDMEQKLGAVIAEALKKAERAPYPEKKQLLHKVYY